MSRLRWLPQSLDMEAARRLGRSRRGRSSDPSRHLGSRRLVCRSHLRGAKPGDLPVQFPVKFEMVVNLKTAKALGLAAPPSIMLRATEVVK
jgi:putative ABC transport system substrate-binding protein